VAKYRKKPVVVEATQWSPGVKHPGVFFTEPMESPSRIAGEVAMLLEPRPYVVTVHEQRAYLSPGDWIIEEPRGGRYYPCKPDIFNATYEPA
jgi:hypothetical protein